MAYEMVMPYHLHMPSYFLETFTEYPEEGLEQGRKEECFKNAKKMKQAGIAFDVIAQVTGLSIGEIASL